MSATDKSGTVYMLTNRNNGRQYIGQTDDIDRRLRNYAAGCCESQPALFHAIKKHGWNSFSVAVLAEGIPIIDGDYTALNQAERNCIAIYRTMRPNGYNLTAGGDAGPVSDETRAKLSAAAIARWQNPAYVNRWTAAMAAAMRKPEIRAKRSAALRKPETRAKMSAAAIARWQNPAYVNRWTAAMAAAMRKPETRAKMSAAQKGKKHTPETRAKLSAKSTAQKQNPAYMDKWTAAHAAAMRKPETRANISASQKGKKLSTETRAKISTASTALWQDPAYVEKWTAAYAAAMRKPETRAKMSAAQKGKKKTPQHRAKISAAATARWQNPENRAAHAAVMNALWQDPAYVDSYAAGQRKRFERERAARWPMVRRAAEMFSGGLRKAAIARELDVSPTTIARWLTEHAEATRAAPRDSLFHSTGGTCRRR